MPEGRAQVQMNLRICLKLKSWRFRLAGPSFPPALTLVQLTAQVLASLQHRPKYDSTALHEDDRAKYSVSSTLELDIR